MSFSFAVAPRLTFPLLLSLSLYFALRFLLLPVCPPACLPSWLPVDLYLIVAADNVCNFCNRLPSHWRNHAEVSPGVLMWCQCRVACPQPPTADPLCGERPVAFIVTNWVSCVCVSVSVCVCVSVSLCGVAASRCGLTNSPRQWPLAGHHVIGSYPTRKCLTCGMWQVACSLPFLAFCLTAEVDTSRRRRSWQTSIFFYLARWVLQLEGETVKWVCNFNSSELFKLKRISQQQQ